MTGNCFHYAAYFTVPSWNALVMFSLFGGLATWMAKYAWGRALLMRYPKLFTRGLFSKQGPTEEQMRSTGFVKTLIVHGFGADTRKGTCLYFCIVVSVFVSTPPFCSPPPQVNMSRRPPPTPPRCSQRPPMCMQWCKSRDQNPAMLPHPSSWSMQHSH